MYYHIVALLAGSLLDWLVGDPYWLPHPIRWIGSWIGWLEKRLLTPLLEGKRNKKKEYARGLVLILLVLLPTLLLTDVFLLGAYVIHPLLGMTVEAILTSYCLAARSLQVESKKVYRALKNQTLQEARQALSMIVGRDTQSLEREGVIKAAVETVAENTSDGIIAPLLALALGGPLLGLFYKAINTMDSMVGYHNEKYEDFGRGPAHFDDLANYIPARVSAWAMILVAFFLPFCKGGKAAEIYKRDRYCHKSPNSAQTESVCAGALGVQLAGPASYFGKTVEKPYIGDSNRPVEVEDIKRSWALMYGTELLILLLVLGIWLIVACLSGAKA